MSKKTTTETTTVETSNSEKIKTHILENILQYRTQDAEPDLVLNSQAYYDLADLIGVSKDTIDEAAKFNSDVMGGVFAALNDESYKKLYEKNPVYQVRGSVTAEVQTPMGEALVRHFPDYLHEGGASISKVNMGVEFDKIVTLAERAEVESRLNELDAKLSSLTKKV